MGAANDGAQPVPGDGSDSARRRVHLSSLGAERRGRVGRRGFLHSRVARRQGRAGARLIRSRQRGVRLLVGLRRRRRRWRRVPVRRPERRRGAPLWRMDPYGRDATSSEGNSRTVDGAFPWTGVFEMPAWNDLVLYELHIGTFNARPGVVGTFDQAIARLDYLRDLGVSARPHAARGGGGADLVGIQSRAPVRDRQRLHRERKARAGSRRWIQRFRCRAAQAGIRRDRNRGRLRRRLQPPRARGARRLPLAVRRLEPERVRRHLPLQRRARGMRLGRHEPSRLRQARGAPVLSRQRDDVARGLPGRRPAPRFVSSTSGARSGTMVSTAATSPRAGPSSSRSTTERTRSSPGS